MFDAAVRAAIVAHAEAEYPKEACGFVVDGAYVRRRNTAEDPCKDFRIAPQAFLAAARQGEIQAVVHSHPNGPAHPSEADMRAQLASAVPWGIVVVANGRAGELFWWGRGAPRPPLIGRPFRHGVTDCYALVRDYYAMELAIELPEFARQDAWWDKGDDLFLRNFAHAGFRRLSPDEALRPSDGLLAQIGRKAVNHCGVYLGNGLLMHHLSNRLSRRDPLEPWRRYVTHYLRYDP